MKIRIINNIIVALLLSILFTGTGLTDTGLLTNPYSSGYLAATGTHFELPNSTYSDFTISSTVPVKLTIRSASGNINMQFMSISNITSTHITLCGLLPYTTYYKYEDDYHNQTVFTTDSAGKYSYTQDLTRAHFIFIILKPKYISLANGPAVKFINDDATGGDCTSIGNWDQNTRTCTLTTDFDGTIQIDSNDITLDGNGYSSSVHIFEKNGFTIQNFIESPYITFSMDPYPQNNNYNYIINNTFLKKGDYPLGSISLYLVSNLTISNNTISNSDWSGIYLTGSKNITITDNTIINNPDLGISSWDMSENNFITDNTFNNNSCCILCDQDWRMTIKNNYFSNSDTGIYQHYTGGNIIFDNIFQNTNTGITLSDGVGCDITGNDFFDNEYCISLYPSYEGISSTITDNKLQNSEYGIYMYSSYEYEPNINIISNTICNNKKGIYIYNLNSSLLYQNEIVDNTDYNAYEYLEKGSNDWNNDTIGNHWSNYDDPSEGCFDIDNNGICDTFYNIPGGSGIDHYPTVHWKYKWIGEGSEGGVVVTTSELRDAVQHWLDDIPVRNHILSTEDLQYIIAIWISR